MQSILLCVFVVFATLSPLLTFARLFQVKEWRWDRLREHLRREGWFPQLFGWVRPAVIGTSFLIVVIFSVFGSVAESPSWMHAIAPVFGALVLLAWFTFFRLVIGKQARPVWTRKAILIVLLSLSFLLSVCVLLSMVEAIFILLFIPLFPFVFVLLSWILLLPIDRYLKMRILRKAASVRLKYKNLTVIGITGSVGKTTTKELLAHILSDRNILVTPVHVNTDLGVAALIINKLKEEHQIFIVEMGAYRKGEIALLCSLTKPSIGVITFIGKQHLGLFGSQEQLCAAKGELFAALPAHGHAFLNADTVFCDNLMKRSACPVHTVGTGGHATYEAFDIQEHTDGIAFSLRGQEFSVPLQGTHQITNVLLAIGVAETLGVPLAESAKRLKTFKGPAQTFEKKKGKSGQILLDDTHNTSPASFRAAIEWARVFNAKSKILITSGLLELGKEESSIHQELGMLSRGIFDEVLFMNKKCVRSFEQGYGKTVKIVPKKKFKIILQKDMLIICEGRMPSSIVERLLA